MRCRPRNTNEWRPVVAGTIVKIDAERTWEIEGESDALDILQAAIGSAGDRVAPTVLHLSFGNSVGIFRSSSNVTFEVHSGKWSEDHFDTMLSDIVSICASLPLLAAADAGALPYQRTESIDSLAEYHAFVYLRHILGSTGIENDLLAPAIEAVLRDPHRHIKVERENVRLERACFVDASTLHSLTAGGSLYRVTGQFRGVPLARALDGALPRTLDQPRSVRDEDTLENRFVRSFLVSAARLIDDVRERILGTKREPLRSRVLSDCDWMQSVLGPWLQHPLWSRVGRLTHLPLGSTVLQGRRGYRDVLRHHLRLMLSTRALPLSAAQTNDLLESRDIAVMYELWTYFSVIAELTSLLGPPANALRGDVSFWGTKVKRGFEVTWASGYRASYNETFAGRTFAESYSLELRPDVTLWCPDGSCHVLDAKFKLARPSKDATSSYENDDIHKMHAYRDAIHSARSAWVMYPGDESEEFPASANTAAWAGVGAVPVRPEAKGLETLSRVLKRLMA